MSDRPSVRPFVIGITFALTGALAALAAARFIESDAWLDALWICGAFTGLCAALLPTSLAFLRWPQSWKMVMAPLLAVAAVAARLWLLALITTTTSGQPRIEPLQLGLAASTVVWGGLALIWGVLAISDALEVAESSRRARLVRVVLAGASVSLSLYALSPLWILLGLKLSIWTVVGLFGLATFAYLVGVLYRYGARLLGRRAGD